MTIEPESFRVEFTFIVVPALYRPKASDPYTSVTELPLRLNWSSTAKAPQKRKLALLLIPPMEAEPP